MRRQRLSRLIFVSLLIAACKSDVAGPPPVLASCVAAQGVVLTLAVGEYCAIDPAALKAPLKFPANTSAIDSAEYLLVPQSATSTADAAGTFLLGSAAVTPVAPFASPVDFRATRMSTPQRFDAFLRRAESSGRFGSPERMAPAGPARAAPSVAAAPPVVGDMRNFRICGDLNCDSFPTVTAIAKSVQSHIALFVDTMAPAGLSQADLDSVATLFASKLYAVDTTAFGRESDIDNNGVVIVLMTPRVNRLVTSSECTTTGFIAGFFFGYDITTGADSRSNHGEIFYSLVADPSGTLSCAHSVTSIKHLIPVTFIHEFQHMISFNQHVLIRHGPDEVLWLNEGLSHFAEELGGRSFLPTDTVSFSRFVQGDLYNAEQYLLAPTTHPLVDESGVGGLAERGAYWLFVRYLADQLGPGITRGLEFTTQTGANNVAAQTGVAFGVTLNRFALAQWVSDLPGFSPPPELTYTSWGFRTVFASLHSQDTTNFPRVFPLVPTIAGGGAINVSDSLHAGSGYYLRAMQAPSGPSFGVTFTGGGGGGFAGSLVPRLNVIRIR